MANIGGGAQALTILSPIRNGYIGESSFADETYKRCMNIRIHEDSPLAKVPDTYLARLYVLKDVLHETKPANDSIFNFNDIFSIFNGKYRVRGLPKVDTLKSRYLVFSSNFHGESKEDLERYLRNMWRHWRYTDYLGETHDIRHVWEHCVAFDKVTSEDEFVSYMHRCALDTTLFFNGSNGESLKEQLKALYVKQEFSLFAVANQGRAAEDVKAAWRDFIERVQLDNLDTPSWTPGQSRVHPPGVQQL